MPKHPRGRKPESGEAAPSGTASSAVEALQVLFGENFRLARVKAGLTQRQIETQTGLKQAYISQIESGKLNPTLASMVALADVVRKDVRALLKPSLHPKPK
jgi:transcriptional regulator with XRE-family HTH domain